MKRRLLSLIGIVCVMVICFAWPASAHPWGTFDVSNDGRVAKVWEETQYDAVWQDVRLQLNQLAEQDGVIFENTGVNGVAGVDWEVHLVDSATKPKNKGSDRNYTYCTNGTCRSWSVVTVSSLGAGYGVFRHEFAHSLGAHHEPCDVISIMHGSPYTPCSINNGINNYQPHDLANYAYNRRNGVYDESLAFTATAGTTSTTSLNSPVMVDEDTLVDWARFNASRADEVHVFHRNGGILVRQDYYPRRVVAHASHRHE